MSPTIYLQGMDNLIATIRSDRVATVPGIRYYGREQADVIMKIAGNILFEQTNDETAKMLSDRFGKIMQDRESLSVNNQDASVSHSKQLEAAVPPTRISALSSGEFVGMVADTPDQPTELKTFHGHLVNGHEAIRRKEARPFR